jgi:hypothetical protein
METGIALFLAFGFAAVGELIFRRRASGVGEWFESFLAGIGCCASLLFPLSLITRHFTLAVLGVTLSVAAATTLVKGARSVNLRAISRWMLRVSCQWRKDPMSTCFVIGIVGAVLVFAVVNWRSTLLWDGLQIWATKAQVLYAEGSLGPDPLIDADFVSRGITYPSLIPLYEALVSLLRQRFAFEDMKPIFLLFYVAMLLSTYRASRSLVSVRSSLVAVAVVAWLPAMTMQTNIGGYADMPLATFFVAAVAACLKLTDLSVSWRSPAPWLIGSLIAVKSEGAILMGIMFASLFVSALLGPGRALPIFQRLWRGGLLVGVMIVLRVGYVRWINYPDPAYAPIDRPHILEAIARFPEVVRACAARMCDVTSWGLFWPAVLVAAGLLVCMGTRAERGVGVMTLAGVVIYSGLFMFTNWDPTVHIDSAYVRLLSQLAPVACVALVAGYWRLVNTLAVYAPPVQPLRNPQLDDKTS